MRLFLAAFVMAAPFCGVAWATPGVAPEDARIVVRLSGFASAAGKAGCTLYRDGQGFPTRPELAAHAVWCPIAADSATCEFPPVPAGPVAIACFHDVNDNGKLDQDWIGLPSEPYVLSNDARPFMGPPRWIDARFDASGSTNLQLKLRN